MRLAAIGVILLLSVSIAWAVEPCMENDCEVIPAEGTACCEAVACRQMPPQPACGCQPCFAPGKPACGKCRPAPCEQVCEPDCAVGMEALMAGSTEIPLPEGDSALDPGCCPRLEYRRIPCEEWCNEYTSCCWPLQYEVLCQPQCNECPPPPPRCRQDTCSEPGGCQCVDTSCGIEVG